MPIDCMNCGKSTWYTPLLDSINFKLFKLFHCWECIWAIGKYEILERAAILDVAIADFQIPPTKYT
jgi:hypothetical protein